MVWNLARVGNPVHDITASVADHTDTVDTRYPVQPKWYQEEIAFPIDGNYKQQPYNAWRAESLHELTSRRLSPLASRLSVLPTPVAWQ